MNKMKIGTQYSLMPDERPDEELVVRKRSSISIQRELEKFLTKEGPYNYAKMIEEIQAKTDEYCIETYAAKKDFVVSVGRSVFLLYTTSTVSLDKFLSELRKNPAYSLNKKFCGFDKKK